MTYIGPTTSGVFFSLHQIKPPPKIEWNRLPIMAFDPGGTTGWSLLILRDGEWDDQNTMVANKFAWFHGQIECRGEKLYDGINKICTMIDQYPYAVIVFEDFWVRQLSADTTPLLIIHSINQHLWEVSPHRNMFKQSASQAKTMATDERLKMWKMYQRDGGLNHARDADRHALLFLRRCLGEKGFNHRCSGWPHYFKGKR